jgi:putative transposase
LFGKTRQAWYKQQWSEEDNSIKDAVIIKLVKEIRQQMPRLGTRKLHYMLAEKLTLHGITIGRDKLFDLLSDYGLLVRRRRRKRVFTTNSNHPFKKYPNLVKELSVQRPDCLWVSDITYIALEEKFCYLNLVTDAYSRKIAGYCLYPTLKKEGTLQALEQALGTLKGKPGKPLIHHSDRGLQYCCTRYIELLQGCSISISMTEKGDPYENAIAERVNGILKEEFALDREFKNFEQALAAVDCAVDTYNNFRPHASCNYLTPQAAHLLTGLIPKRWKPKKRKEVLMPA